MDVLELKTELEKMTVKEKMSALNSGDTTMEGSTVSDRSLSEEANREKEKSAMVYINSYKVLDLKKLMLQITSLINMYVSQGKRQQKEKPSTS